MKSFFVLTIFVFFFLSTANGQIYGIVYVNNKPQYKVKIKVVLNRKVVAKTESDSNGEYNINVERGKTYSLHFKAKGFSPRVISSVSVPNTGQIKFVQKIKRKKRVKLKYSSELFTQ